MRRPLRLRIYCNVCTPQERLISDVHARTGFRTLPPVRHARRTGKRYVCECCGADVTNLTTW